MEPRRISPQRDASDLETSLTEVLDAAIALVCADFGNIQLRDAGSGDLRLVAQRGFPQWWLDFWHAHGNGPGNCDMAVKRNERIVMEDVEQNPNLVDTPALEIQRKAGVRAVQSTPLMTRSGEPLGVFSTHWKVSHRPDVKSLRLLDLFARQAADIIERAQMEQALRRSEDRVRKLEESRPMSQAILDSLESRIVVIDQDGCITAANVAWNVAWHTIAAARSSWEGVNYLSECARAADTGDELAAQALRGISDVLDGTVPEFSQEYPCDTPTERLWFAMTVTPLVGQTSGVVVAHHDITERKLHEERVQFLTRELNHRSKNMLALVQAIARETAATSADNFVERFDERVKSLSAAQDLLVKNEWEAVPLDDLVRSQLSHFADFLDTRISISGPPLRLTPAATQTLGMALHELATNAAKYGALSTPGGRVDIEWRVLRDETDRSRFSFSWHETGGPEVTPPTQTGFGSTVINDMVRMNLGAEAKTEFVPTGLAWEVNTSSDRCIKEFHGRPATPQQPSGRGQDEAAHSGIGRRILIVEDEALMALVLEKALADAGYEVVGVARSVSDALARLEQTDCDAAILDVNLGGASAEPIARKLADRGTPFFAVSGYERGQLPDVFEAARLFQKPVNFEALIAELGASLAHGAVDERCDVRNPDLRGASAR